ncbi:MAG: ATP-binding protein, partial [Bryobacteraceae bacterium]
MPDWSPEPPITPSVCEEHEFLEIAEDFSNPCEIFREALSNSFDAGATEMHILLTVVPKGFRQILRIEIADNGRGMSRDELCAFFDLGNSTNRGKPETIGDKGHGTKIYYKSSRIEVITNKDGCQLRADVRDAYDALANGSKPVVSVSSKPSEADKGTRIIIDDYNYSIRDKFTHSILKDYIHWFTKFGSVERELGIERNAGAVLWLKGVDRSEPERLTFGHVFPPVSEALDKLLDIHKGAAPEHFVRKWPKQPERKVLKNFPDIAYEVVFYLEGDAAKRAVNPLIRGKGRTVQGGAYNVQDRYGLWLCKDHIPIQRANERITVKGSEF